MSTNKTIVQMIFEALTSDTVFKTNENLSQSIRKLGLLTKNNKIYSMSHSTIANIRNGKKVGEKKKFVPLSENYFQDFPQVLTKLLFNNTNQLNKMKFFFFLDEFNKYYTGLLSGRINTLITDRQISETDMFLFFDTLMEEAKNDQESYQSKVKEKNTNFISQYPLQDNDYVGQYKCYFHSRDTLSESIETCTLSIENDGSVEINIKNNIYYGHAALFKSPESNSTLQLFTADHHGNFFAIYFPYIRYNADNPNAKGSDRKRMQFRRGILVCNDTNQSFPIHSNIIILRNDIVENYTKLNFNLMNENETFLIAIKALLKLSREACFIESSKIKQLLTSDNKIKNFYNEFKNCFFPQLENVESINDEVYIVIRPESLFSNISTRNKNSQGNQQISDSEFIEFMNAAFSLISISSMNTRMYDADTKIHDDTWGKYFLNILFGRDDNPESGSPE